MITKTQAYQTSDNSTHASLADAQKHELLIELKKIDLSELGDKAEKFGESVATHLLANCDKVADILTMKATSKPRARKVNKTKTPTT